MSVLNALDRAIAAISPSWGFRRARARAALAAADVAYEAARQSRLRRLGADHGSGNKAIYTAGPTLRAEARRLERNHDIARGALNTLEQNIVGPSGIGVEPTPMTLDGEVHEELAWQIKDLWDNWTLTPETSRLFDWPAAQRVLCRSWLRDGEVLTQDVIGNVPSLDHGTLVPYSLELIEADLLDWDYHDAERGIRFGVEADAWGRARAYHLFKQHPGEPDIYGQPDRKRVSADRIRHLALRDRIGQARGVSIFASVLTRLSDIKDYEESERVAAKVAASMAAFVKRGTPDMYGEASAISASGSTARPQHFQPGMFIELAPGEDVGMIDTKRPNMALEPFRDGQLRASAAGLRLSFSSLAKKYDGTYSAQRQELVEQWGAYALLSAEFAHQMVRPVYRRFIAAAQLSGALKIPRDVVVDKIADALYVPQSMPWIDPQKEANAWATLEANHYIAAPEIIRRRGGNPRDVLKQAESWNRQKREYGLDAATNTAGNA